MPPRNLLFAIALGAFAALAHPFLFIRRFAGSRHSFARSKVDTARWTPELLKRLEWRRFEELCAAYFEAQGFRAELAGADGGAISLYEQGAPNVSILVHCSPWNAYRVGIKPVRELRGAMTAGNVGEGVLVTSGKFTQEARAFAGKEQIRLVDGDELVDKIGALLPEKALALLKLATQGDFRTPTCPSCTVKMIPRKSTAQGRTYWGCRNYPACKHTFSGTVA
jgi:restriction system protein